MNAKDLLLEQTKACHTEQSWFAPLANAIKGLTEEQANWKPEGSHSIKGIVQHIYYWNNRLLQAFKEQELEKVITDNTLSFEESSNENWDTTVQKLNALMNDWNEQIAGATEDKLTSPTSKTSPNLWYQNLMHQNIHTAHHTGQIITLRKIQGSWTPDLEVK